MELEPRRITSVLTLLLAATVLIGPLASPPALAGEARMELSPSAEQDAPARHPANLVRAVQRGLIERGFDPGPVDGIVGPKTRAALRAYQANSGLDVDGEIDSETLKSLELFE